MKTFKRALSALLAMALAATTFAVAATMTASAASDNVYNWTAFNRHIGWGEWPQNVTYTDGGYVSVSDTGRFAEQYQVYYPVTSQEDKDYVLDMIKLACSNGDGYLDMDVEVFGCSNVNVDRVEEDTQMNVKLELNYKYTDLEDDSVNELSWAIDGWFAADGQTHTLKLSVDDYDVWYSDPEYYSDFEVTGFVLHFMNYNTLAVAEDLEYNGITVKAGTKGLGFIDAQCSPIYVNNSEAPAKGTDIGVGYEFIPNENREQIANPKNGKLVDKYPGTFIIDGLAYQQNDEGTQIDGPLGNGADIVRVPVEIPTTAEPTTAAPTTAEPTTAAPTTAEPTTAKPAPTGPSTVKYGDADGNGAINMLDVLLIRKYIAKQPVTPNLEASDVTHEGAVNMLDVLKIRKFIAKQPVDLSKA